MITPMRHVTLLSRGEDAETLLDHLREAGVLHLDITRKSNRNVERLEQDLEQIQKVIQHLETLPPVNDDPVELAPDELVRELRCREVELNDIQAVDNKLLREEKAWEPFGNIRGATLRALETQGIHVRFYRERGGNKDQSPNMGKEVTWIPAREGFGLAISLNAPPELEAELLTMPVRSPELIRSRRESLADLADRHRQAVARHTASLDMLKAHRDAQADALAYTRAHLGMGREGELSWVTGFAPEETLDAVTQLAETSGAALLSREPGETDAPPTLLKQSPVVSWIQPVFNFLGVTPGYTEVDVGWSFLIFLSLFSGMIIGDAGYGVLLIATVAALNALKPASRGQFANLLYLMGGATVLWGLLTGNVFGMERLPVWLESVRIDALADMSDPKPVMNVCFVLGAFHLTLAHLWNLWRHRRSLQALAEIGWIGSTWTMYCLTGVMVLGWDALPGFTVPLFLLSALLIVIFMTPPKKLKEQWVDHMMLPLTFVNNFVDVVSYVRLYAVGMATFALASSFNTMILGGSESRGWIAGGVMMIILVLGHALNFILAGMGVMVHGIRLNTLEFASHLGLTWSGIPYAPFRRMQQSEPLSNPDL